MRAYRKKFEIPYPIAMNRSRMTVPGDFQERRADFPITLVFRPDGKLSCAWMGSARATWFEAERDFALS